MAQIKLYGLCHSIKPMQTQISDVLHSCLIDALKLPENKRFHRFIYLEADEFIYPEDRSEQYLIIEISMFEGRSAEVKKQLIQLIYARFAEQLQFDVNDIELTIFETPRQNWGIRGLPADELRLNYTVKLD